jgi:hypothetical protein
VGCVIYALNAQPIVMRAATRRLHENILGSADVLVLPIRLSDKVENPQQIYIARVHTAFRKRYDLTHCNEFSPIIS